VTCDADSPDVTARARREPMVPDAVRTQRGPGLRAWKARPVPSSWPDATPMAQVTAACCRPLLTVSDRQMPVLRARGGHGRRGPTALQRAGAVHKLNRRVRPVHDDHLPRWQVVGDGAAVHRRCSTMIRWGMSYRRWMWASGNARRTATVGATTVRHCASVRSHRYDQVFASMSSAISAGDCGTSPNEASRWSTTVKPARWAASSTWRSSSRHPPVGSGWL